MSFSRPNKPSRDDFRIAERLVETFRPRMDVFAERLDDVAQVDAINAWVRERTKANEKPRLFRLGDWKPVRRGGQYVPVTIARIAEHVAGMKTLGFYPLHPDGTCNSVSVDLDNHHGARAVERDPRVDFDLVTSVLLRRGVRFLANTSRGGGGFWVHILPPVGARASEARAVLHAVLREATVQHITKGGTFDDLCPKQDEPPHRGDDGVASPGNLFCLPLSRRWLAAARPGTHFVGTNPTDMNEQLRSLETYE